jgi:2,5-diketo-D-gluconate reductase A
MGSVEFMTTQETIVPHLDLGDGVTIPKSVTPARIEENFELFDFALGDDEMAAIRRLDAGERIGPDPATFGS